MTDENLDEILHFVDMAYEHDCKAFNAALLAEVLTILYQSND